MRAPCKDSEAQRRAEELRIRQAPRGVEMRVPVDLQWTCRGLLAFER